MAYHISTRCQHLEGQNKEEHYGAISYPIYPSSAFIHQEVGGKIPTITLVYKTPPEHSWKRWWLL